MNQYFKEWETRFNRENPKITGGIDAEICMAELLEACKAQEAADLKWTHCPDCCEAIAYPELCEDCMALFDEARLKRRAAIAKAEGQ